LAVHKYEVSPALCSALVQAGAHLDVSDSIGTPLHIAIAHYSLDVVKALLSAHSRFPDTVSRALLTYNHHGDLPLHTALHARSAHVIQLLVDAGVDVDAPNQHGTFPLVLAVRYNDTASARVLLQKKPNKRRLGDALIYATHHGKLLWYL
jgi:ankyrin repeat protein